ncbi:MAG: hypothetical protein AAF519_00210 [Bacteroidota bacterium]
MHTLLTISTSTIPSILKAFESLDRSLERIEHYACEDFRSTKNILDTLDQLKIEHIVSKEAKEQLSAIISNLQYVDVLQQRLSHVLSINTILKEELIDFNESSKGSIIAYQMVVQLNLKQFHDAVDRYLHTTDAVHNALTEISKNHKMLFLHIPETRMLYKYNSEILREATIVSEIHVKQLLKYRHASAFVAKEYVSQVKHIASFYTMEQERIVLDSFLRGEMDYEQGYDLDSDKEQISLF